MRELLKNLDGRRITVTAKVERFGSKTAFKGPPLKTILLTDLRGTANEVLADHLWFVQSKGFAALNLVPGERIKFDARSRQYTKGYRGYREDEDLPAVETDYRLSHPTNIRRIEAAPIEGELFK